MEWIIALVVVLVIGMIFQLITTTKNGAPEHHLVTEHKKWLKNHPDYSPRGGDHSL